MSKTQKQECLCCAETITAKTRAVYHCSNHQCNEDGEVYCVKCAQTHFLTSQTCMKCGAEQPISHILGQAPKKYCKELFGSMLEEFVSSQKSAKSISDTMPRVKWDIHVEKQRGKIKEIDSEVKKLKDEIFRLKQQRAEYVHSINYDGRFIPDNEIVEDRVEKYIKCPLEGCRGYLDNKKVCGVCSKKICTKCMKIKEEDHECDPNEVASIKALSSFKKCPGCGLVTEKHSGCTQMFCAPDRGGCGKFWDYNNPGRGTFDPRFKHNPEYFRMLSKQNAEGGQAAPVQVDPCREFVTYYEVSTFSRQFKIMIDYLVKDIREKKVTNITEEDAANFNFARELVVSMFRIKNHLEDVTQREYPADMTEKLDRLRIKLIRNQIKDKDYEDKLKLILRTQCKNREIRDVIDTTKRLIDDHIRNAIDYTSLQPIEIKSKVLDWICSAEKLRINQNKAFKLYGDMFGKTTNPCITRYYAQEYSYNSLKSDLSKRKTTVVDMCFHFDPSETRYYMDQRFKCLYPAPYNGK